MIKLISWLIFASIVIYLSGLYPHVAVGVTAVSIVFIFVVGSWLGE